MIVAVGIQTFSKWVIVLSYEINKDYIAKNLCVNKANTVMHCMGKCYLKKKLIAEESNEQQAGKVSFEKDIQLELFYQETYQSQFSIISSIVNHTSLWIDRIPQCYISSFFQPPQPLAVAA